MPIQPDQIDKLKMMLQSAGWNEVVRPVMANRAKQALQALSLDLPERTGDWKGKSDESIRGALREMEWLLAAFTNEVAIADHNRRLEELDRQPPGMTPGSTANP